MICKCPPARNGQSSFARLVSYILTAKEKGQKTEERVLYSGTRNLATADRPMREMIEEMTLLAKMNKRCRNPVFHGIISFRENEVPTAEQCREAVEIYVREHNLGLNQAIWAAHHDTKNVHIHVCVNRIEADSLRAVHVEFYKRANERAARKIEVIQGWQRDQGHLVDVVEVENERGEIVNKVQDRERSKFDAKTLSTGARDFENHSGEKSAERIAQERAAKPLFNANSWADLHKQLAEVGIEIHPKGSGGILIVNGKPVKLSIVSRQVAWKKLVERMGEFVPRDPEIVVKKIGPELLVVKNTDIDDRKLRYMYSSERRDFYAERRKAYAAFDAWRKEEVDKQKRQHKTDRDELNQSQNWQGHGAELNLERSLLAARHAANKAALKELIQRRKKELRIMFDAQFLKSYEGWLESRQQLDEAERWRYRNYAAVIFGKENTYHEPMEFAGLRAEVATVGKRKVINYSRDGRIVFADNGRNISIVDSTSETAVLAAMKIAAEKWGTLNVYGSQSFIDLTVKLAARNGIRLRDPELQARVEEERKIYLAQMFKLVVTENDNSIGDRSSDGGDRYPEDKDRNAANGTPAEERDTPEAEIERIVANAAAKASDRAATERASTEERRDKEAERRARDDERERREAAAARRQAEERERREREERERVKRKEEAARRARRTASREKSSDGWSR